MRITVGNHMKLNARPELRERLRTFYGGLLGGQDNARAERRF